MTSNPAARVCRRCATRSASSRASRGRAAAGTSPRRGAACARTRARRRRARARRTAWPRTEVGSSYRVDTRGHYPRLPPCPNTRYDPPEIEPRWQRVWADERTWEVEPSPAATRRRRAAKSYVLEMLPYPSGEPHIGHLKVYSVGDAVAHFHRRTGRRVLHPMGYDAFGLPAENHAIKTGQHPRASTDARSPSSSASSASGGSRSTGRASSRPATRGTTAGRSGSFSSCLSPDWRTARLRLTGAPMARPCWPTSRSWKVFVSGAIRGDAATWSSGSSASPATLTTDAHLDRLTGLSALRRCNATGSAAVKVPRSRSAGLCRPSTQSQIRSSPPGRTLFLA